MSTPLTVRSSRAALVSAGAPTSGHPLSLKPPVKVASVTPMFSLPKPASRSRPPLRVAPAAEKVTFSADMLFNFDKSTLKDEGKAVLDDLVSRLAGVNVEVILSTGYADRLGKDAYNEKLSAARAESVKTYLVSKGVDANLIQTEGRGEADPVVDCPNPSAKGQVKNFRELVQCLAPNRRAVVEVVGTRQ